MAALALPIHLTAKELAGLRLPGFPASERGWQLRAERDGWQAQRRAGPGGGRVWPVESMPAELREAIATKLAGEAAEKAPVVAPRRAAGAGPRASGRAAPSWSSTRARADAQDAPARRQPAPGARPRDLRRGPERPHLRAPGRAHQGRAPGAPAPADRPRPLEEPLPRISGFAQFEPLGLEDVRLLRQELVEVPVAEEVDQEVYRQSRGYVREVMNALAEVERIGKRSKAEVSATDIAGLTLIRNQLAVSPDTRLGRTALAARA